MKLITNLFIAGILAILSVPLNADLPVRLPVPKAFGTQTGSYRPLDLGEKPAQATDFIKLAVGIERLNYQTVEPDTEKSSQAEVVDSVARFDISQEYESVLTGLKGVVPYSAAEDTEREDYANIANYQVNKFEYKVTRIDGYLGYRFDEDIWTGPAVWYAGLRYSDAKQSRSDFYISDVYQPAMGEISQQVKSYSFLIGYQGGADLVENTQKGWSKEKTKPVLKGSYQIEYGIPIYNKVTRSDIPQVTFHNRNGYEVELKGGLSYVISSVVTIDVDLYGGRMYWKGDKQPTGELWRENKTDYVGTIIGFSVTF